MVNEIPGAELGVHFVDSSELAAIFPDCSAHVSNGLPQSSSAWCLSHINDCPLKSPTTNLLVLRSKRNVSLPIIYQW